MSDDKGNLKGSYRQDYVPSLKGGNPEKKKEYDWWDEICKKHGAKNHFKKKNK
jgi:hypothetical protein